MITQNSSRRVPGRIFTALVSLLAAVAQAQNANVTWQTPVTIAGASDVSTLGTYYGSWAPYNGSANTMPVNGVAFQGYPDLPGLTYSFDGGNGGYNMFGSPNTADNNYNALLEYGQYSGGPGNSTFSW